MSLMEVKNLEVKSGNEHILRGINFTVKKDYVIGITGESGAGKSILSKSLIGLLSKEKFKVSGEIIFKGLDLNKLQEKELRKIRGNQLGIVFQNPMRAFNPIIKVGYQMIETIICNQNICKKEAKKIVVNMIDKLKIGKPEKIMKAYPYELSGGMMQRVILGCVMLQKPQILIADEPTTALDNKNKRVVIEELIDTKKENELTIILISHDYRILEEVCDEIVVMREGRIIDSGTNQYIFNSCKEEYVRKLLQKKIV